MAMQVMHNNSAMMALGELRKNDSSLGKNLRKVASGMRVNSAGDDSSAYAISERMRVRLRGLDQATDNVKTGRNMINLASAAVDQQVQIMQQIGRRAMQASDDTYTDVDRQTLNKEISQLLDEVDDIANETSYNGIPLLNQRRVSSETQWFDADAPYHLNPAGVVAMTSLSSGNYSPNSANYVAFSAAPPNTYDPNQLGAGNAYTSLPVNGATVWNNATNQQDTVTVSNGVLVFASNNQPIEVQGKLNGTVAGQNTNVSQIAYTAPYTTVPALGTSVVYTTNGRYPGTAATIQAEPGSGTPKIAYSGSQYSAEIDFSSLFAGALNIPKDLDGHGFSMMCGGCDQYVTIQFDADSSDTKLYVGEKSQLNPKPMCYVVGVSNVKTQQDLEQAVFNGIVTAGADRPEYSGSTAAMQTTLPSTKNATAAIASQHNIRLNYYANPVTGHTGFSITKDSPPVTFLNGVMGAMVTDWAYKPEQFLKIQSTTKANQNINVNMPNTTTDILFPKSTEAWDISPTEADYPSEYSSDYSQLNDAQKLQQWKDTEWQYPSKFVQLDKNNCVGTREKASIFLDQVNQAMKYLLYSNTTLGAQSSRLDQTEDNLVTSAENTQASESQIRDADMARAYTDYTKSNILSQAAQSMLAQANQESSSVMRLLQG